MLVFLFLLPSVGIFFEPGKASARPARRADQCLQTDWGKADTAVLRSATASPRPAAPRPRSPARPGRAAPRRAPGRRRQHHGQRPEPPLHMLCPAGPSVTALHGPNSTSTDQTPLSPIKLLFFTDTLSRTSQYFGSVPSEFLPKTCSGLGVWLPSLAFLEEEVDGLPSRLIY